MKLRPEHMRMICPALNFNYDRDVLEPTNWTTAKGLLQDIDFGFEYGKHNPDKLLLLGFMYCQFEREELHVEMLWRQANPNFRETVSLRIVKVILEDLLYIAIDQRLKMLLDSFSMKSKHLKEFLRNC
mmetsp:Transcript_31202/g.41299  ORF Transcript_31202/g.41299 Transcript_31202/m.41299 type:complete len:128 (+) Transcript_31202:175-558(+)